MNALATLEAQMLAIAGLHGLTDIKFAAGILTEGSLEHPFRCTMHHEKLATAIHGVTFGYGDTMQAAYEDAASLLHAARAPKLEQAA